MHPPSTIKGAHTDTPHTSPSPFFLLSTPHAPPSILQVSTYACIYTSKASNLGLVSPERWFRTVRDLDPHDYLLGTGALGGTLRPEDLEHPSHRAHPGMLP